MSRLAILGGEPTIDAPFPVYNSIGAEEIEAVNRVMRSGVLSKFVGAWCDDFYGGETIQQFEADWSKLFRVAHCVSVNSATSGIYAALGAVGIGPGDEVIVPPFTMSATAMAPLIYGGIPVFVDIEPETFCLDPQQVRANITTRTKAIIVVNLFGHAAQLKELRALADEHGIKLIEDNAQGPLATESGKFAGTIGHIGVFSLNYHKHIHTGEGGMCVTEDENLARRMQMIRNHGENVVEAQGIEDLTNLVGYNYRMTELCAAVGIEQLKKAELHVSRREQMAAGLSQATGGLAGITPPVVRPGCRHVYYVWAARYDEEIVGVSREVFSEALAAEGVPNAVGYVEPLYMLPLFQKKIALGRSGFPFNLSERQYLAGMCPVTERMHQRELLEFHICSHEISEQQMDLVGRAFGKVHAARTELQKLEKSRLEERGIVVGSRRS